jgi:hypothetical protein
MIKYDVKLFISNFLLTIQIAEWSDTDGFKTVNSKPERVPTLGHSHKGNTTLIVATMMVSIYSKNFFSADLTCKHILYDITAYADDIDDLLDSPSVHKHSPITV